MLLHHLTADLGNLPLQTAHTRLASVITHDVANRSLFKLDLTLLQAIGHGLLGHQVLDRDIDLLIFRVARQTDDFHPVQQRTGDIHRVGCTDEHHIRKVVVDLQIMVVEVVVLLGIEHFQQRRGRIATHVAAHLVDLVEQEQRVAHAHLGHLLDQATWHRADVGTPVTANLGLVTHATQGHAHELAIGRTRDGLGQRGLAHTGRTNQAKHRPLEFLHPLLHSEILENALLDLFQAIVVGIENIFGLG